MIPTDVRDLILTFVRNTFRSLPETLVLASIKCARRWHKIGYYISEQWFDAKNIPRVDTQIKLLQRFGAVLHSGAEDVKTLCLKMTLNDQFQCQVMDGFDTNPLLPDRPIWNMLKCWRTQTDHIRARDCLRLLRVTFMAHMVAGGFPPASALDPENHRQLFILAMHQARLDMFDAKEELEPLHPFYYS
jgi:hypothetical protein